VLVTRSVLVLTALLAVGSAAEADPVTPTLPTLALDPQAPSPSVWKGLYAGTDIFFSGGRGSKGLVGGGAFVGYDRHLDNNLVLGVQASVGYAPFSLQHSPFKGYDYGELSAKVGYEMGRFTPYLTTGVALTKPNGNPGEGYFSAAD
jgi:opacity protein-like surface antigen